MCGSILLTWISDGVIALKWAYEETHRLANRQNEVSVNGIERGIEDYDDEADDNESDIG